MRRLLLSALSLIGMLALGGHADAQCGPNGCSVGFAGPFGGGYSLAPAYRFAPSYAVPTYAAPAITATPTTYTVPAPRQLHKRRDARGVVYQCTDLARLEAYIDGLNAGHAQAAQTRVSVTRTTSATACPVGCGCSVPGQCGRTGCNCVADVPPPPPTP